MIDVNSAHFLLVRIFLFVCFRCLLKERESGQVNVACTPVAADYHFLQPLAVDFRFGNAV